MILCLLAVVALSASAQVVTTPAILQQGYKGEVTITFDPAMGDKGLVDAKECYLYSCVQVDNKMDGAKPKWEYQLADWPSKTDKTKMSKNGSKWEIKIPNLYDFYGVPEGKTITKILVLFTDGVKDGKAGRGPNGADIEIEVVKPGLSVSIIGDIPEVADKGSTVSLICNATLSATLTLKQNGQVVKTATGTELSYITTLPNEGDYVFDLEAVSGTETASASVMSCVATAPEKKNRPAGVVNGIYYNSDSKVTLCTYASSKTEAAKHVFVVGDFNDWKVSNDYQLKQANDSAYFWIELDGLTPKKEYAFQYVVVRSDGVIKRVCDLYSEKVLHPDDNWGLSEKYPDLMPYPAKGDGYVTVIQPGKSKYEWSDATLNFKRPDKNNLIIYEIWVGDFTPDRNFQGMMERLDYLENLGVNAVELMPVTEFEFNQSWGYNPILYFALDKAYGTPEDMKAFVDECHKRGIAVILDMVFNHTYGPNPAEKLYPYGNDLKENPWFIEKSKVKHDDNNFGEDWNHDFTPAHYMFTRVLNYWIQEYKVDGYRLDLSHGLCGDTKYNAVDNLKDYYSKGVVAADSKHDAYLILEHWGSSASSDYPALTEAGMMPWNKYHYQFAQIAMGYTSSSDISGASKDNFVSYSESHDEEHNFFKAKKWGDGDIKSNEDARVKRVPMVLGLLSMMDGSKMFYHYEEIGFDYSKYQNAKGQWGNDEAGNDKDEYYGGVYYDVTPDLKASTKMEPKPRPEKWINEGGERMQAYKKVAQIFQLRTRLLPEVFKGNPTAVSVGGSTLRTIQWSSDVFVAANMSAKDNQTVNLPSGTWYDYLGGATKAAANYTLQPGEIKVFTGSQITPPEVKIDYYLQDLENIFFDRKPADTRKILRDGQVLILRGDNIYDMTGRRVK